MGLIETVRRFACRRGQLITYIPGKERLIRDIRMSAYEKTQLFWSLSRESGSGRSYLRT